MGVTMEWWRDEGSEVTEVRLRFSDRVLADFSPNALDLALTQQASRPDASIADTLLALEALVRSAEK